MKAIKCVGQIQMALLSTKFIAATIYYNNIITA